MNDLNKLDLAEKSLTVNEISASLVKSQFLYKRRSRVANQVAPMTTCAREETEAKL